MHAHMCDQRIGIFDWTIAWAIIPRIFEMLLNEKALLLHVLSNQLLLMMLLVACHICRCYVHTWSSINYYFWCCCCWPYPCNACMQINGRYDVCWTLDWLHGQQFALANIAPSYKWPHFMSFKQKALFSTFNCNNNFFKCLQIWKKIVPFCIL